MWTAILVLNVILCLLLSPPLLTSLGLIKESPARKALTLIWVLLLCILAGLVFTLVKIRNDQGLRILPIGVRNWDNLFYIGICAAGLVYTSPWSMRKQVKRELPRAAAIALWIVRIGFVFAILCLVRGAL